MMAKLNTPFGYVAIMIDGQEIEYHPEQLQCDGRFCPDVIGRYKIVVDFVPDGNEHIISCVLPEAVKFHRSPESGEGLECQSFYNKDRCKLSIGLEGEAGYFEDGTRVSDEYDYNADYLDNGMAYFIEKNTKTSSFVIGIAWIDDVGLEDEMDDENDRDVQTWFAADPALM